MCCISSRLTYLLTTDIAPSANMPDVALWVVTNYQKYDHGKPRDRTMGCHLPYGITQCYLPTDTSKLTPP